MRRILNEYSQQLIALTVSECIDFFPHPTNSEILITAPKLRKLVLHSVHVDNSSHEFFSSLFRGFPNLAYLDLSDCNHVGDLSCVSHCPNLTTLILYNVSGLQDAIGHICKLTGLRYCRNIRRKNIFNHLIIYCLLIYFFLGIWTFLKVAKFREDQMKRMEFTTDPITLWLLWSKAFLFWNAWTFLEPI